MIKSRCLFRNSADSKDGLQTPGWQDYEADYLLSTDFGINTNINSRTVPVEVNRLCYRVNVKAYGFSKAEINAAHRQPPRSLTGLTRPTASLLQLHRQCHTLGGLTYSLFPTFDTWETFPCMFVALCISFYICMIIFQQNKIFTAAYTTFLWSFLSNIVMTPQAQHQTCLNVSVWVWEWIRLHLQCIFSW